MKETGRAKSGRERVSRRRRILRWVFRRRTAKVLLWGAVLLVTVVVLFYQVEWWRGARAWEAAKKDYLAAGGVMDLSRFVPPPVPDEENFGALPILTEIGIEESELGERNRQRLQWTRGEGLGTRRVAHAPWPGPNERRRAIYLPRWAEYLRVERGMDLPRQEAAEKVLVAIEERIGTELAELAAGVDRPESQLSPEFYERLNDRVLYGLWTHVHSISNVIHALHARGLAAAEVGDRKLARESIAISMQLGRMLRSGWISGARVGNGAQANAERIVRQGMGAGLWTKGDLKWISQQFDDPEARRALKEACEAETIVLTRFIGAARSGETGKVDMANLMGPLPRVKRALLKLAPGGWSDRDRATVLRLSQPLMELEGGNEQFREMLMRAERMEEELREREESWSPSSYYFNWLSPQLSYVVRTSMELEMRRRLVRTACAIELHRRGKGRLPTGLEELVPGFLAEVPRDLMDGHALRYRGGEDGKFTLYAIGRDGVDNGGTPSAPGRRGQDGTDLVWETKVW